MQGVLPAGRASCPIPNGLQAGFGYTPPHFADRRLGCLGRQLAVSPLLWWWSFVAQDAGDIVLMMVLARDGADVRGGDGSDADISGDAERRS